MKKILFTFLILNFVLTGCFLKKSSVVNNVNKKQEGKRVEENINKQEDRIDDWKIFKNNRYNFSIKYPSTAYTWIESDGSSSISLEQINEIIISDSRDSELFVHVEVKDPSYSKYDEYISSKKEILESSLKDYANKIWELNSELQSVKESGLSKISFKGRDAYTFSSSEGYQDEMGGSVHSSKINYIFTEDKGLKYVFGFSDTKISKEVLETFQFSADEIADWKTYRNEEYGFEMKYPNNWNEAAFGMEDLTEEEFNDFKKTFIIGFNKENFSNSIFINLFNKVALEKRINKSIDKTERRTINGFNYYKHKNNLENFFIIPIEKDKNILLIIRTTDNNKDLFLENIISTFKFIK